MPLPSAAASDLSLESTEFRFIDPPEPGAHARVLISVANHASTSSGRILLGIPASWFEAYSIIGTGPAVSADLTDATGLRTFSFPPLTAGTTASFELHVTATGEGTQAPSIKVLLDNGDTIGVVDKLSTLEVGLFIVYPRLKRLDVDVATDKGQFKRDLKSPQRTISLIR